MKEATVPSAPIYPELPDAPPDQSYRLHEVARLKKHLEDERDKREALYKKYRRGVNILDGVDTALFTASMGMGVGGVGLLSTIIAAPVVLGLEIAALACGILGVSGNFIGRRLAAKAKKHDNIRILAESKLNTITDHVSNALMDCQLSDTEFRLITAEVNKYTQMKTEIRAGAIKAHAAVTLDGATKKSLIAQGREEARASFIKKLGGN
jgi:hypothetical protein